MKNNKVPFNTITDNGKRKRIIAGQDGFYYCSQSNNIVLLEKRRVVRMFNLGTSKEVVVTKYTFTDKYRAIKNISVIWNKGIVYLGGVQ